VLPGLAEAGRGANKSNFFPVMGVLDNDAALFCLPAGVREIDISPNYFYKI
jgi:hypothetical protein